MHVEQMQQLSLHDKSLFLTLSSYGTEKIHRKHSSCCSERVCWCSGAFSTSLCCVVSVEPHQKHFRSQHESLRKRRATRVILNQHFPSTSLLVLLITMTFSGQELDNTYFHVSSVFSHFVAPSRKRFCRLRLVKFASISKSRFPHLGFRNNARVASSRTPVSSICPSLCAQWGEGVKEKHFQHREAGTRDGSIKPAGLLKHRKQRLRAECHRQVDSSPSADTQSS
jgi:hypothetical protein